MARCFFFAPETAFDTVFVAGTALAADVTIGRTIEFNNGDLPIGEALPAG